MGNDLLFSTGRIKSVEKKLLSQDKIARLTDCATLSDAVNVLSEYGYGGGYAPVTPFEYEKILSEEENIFDKYIKDLLPEGYGFEVFFAKNDFHNAKIIVKSKYFSVPIPKEAEKRGYLFDFDKLNDKIMLDTKETELPEALKNALEALDEKNTAGKLKPSDIDAELDKAFVNYVFSTCKGEKSKVIRQYFSLLSDMNNLLTFHRAKSANLSKEQFERMLLPKGTIEKGNLLSAYETGDTAKLKESLKGTTFERLFSAIENEETSSLVNSERIRDEILSDYINSFKADVFSIGCVINFYISKQTEIKNIRIILTGKKNNIPANQIKNRLRKIYA